MLHPGGGAHPAYRFWTVNGPLETTRLAFHPVGYDDVDQPVIQLSGSQSREVRFRSDFGGGRALSITFTFSGDRYTFICDAQGEGLDTVWVRDYA
jgi:hypothetical protein